MTAPPTAIRRACILALTAVTAATTLATVAAPAQAATAPPQFTDAAGLTVLAKATWADANQRTFTLTVRTDKVPGYQVLPGQVSGEHVILVTLPVGYDPAGTTRYPVHYHLHGGGDYPNSQRNLRVAEQATASQPLITVTPNGGGRSWYSNWINPGSAGKQDWESFHLDQVIPFIDANLRTIASRAGRAISGHSMGGFGAFHYAEHRPELFSYVGSFSGGLDLLNQKQRAAVVGTTQLASYGEPTVPIDSIFGPPIWPLDGVWNRESPAQHVGPLRGMGVAMYTGNGGDLLVDPIQAQVEVGARETAAVTSANLTAAGIPHDFVDYGDGSSWAPGCTGKHNQEPCLQAGMNHFVPLIMSRLQRP